MKMKETLTMIVAATGLISAVANCSDRSSEPQVPRIEDRHLTLGYEKFTIAYGRDQKIVYIKGEDWTDPGRLVKPTRCFYSPGNIDLCPGKPYVLTPEIEQSMNGVLDSTTQFLSLVKEYKPGIR